VSREKVESMLAVLNKRWLSMGWRIMDPDDAEPMALAFIEVLDNAGVPYQSYPALYQAAVAFRAEQMQQGKRIDDFSAELMRSCWPALKEQMNFDRQNKIAADRQLAQGGEPCPGDIAEKLEKFGVKI
jgi:hypothetical protein